MFKSIAVLAFSFLSIASAVADEASLMRAYDPTSAHTALDDTLSAEWERDAAADVAFTGSIAQPPVEAMGDGLAAERSSLAAALDALPLVAQDWQVLAFSEAELVIAPEPTATGSLGETAWEAEEPALVQAYMAGREAFEATLTP